MSPRKFFSQLSVYMYLQEKKSEAMGGGSGKIQEAFIDQIPGWN